MIKENYKCIICGSDHINVYRARLAPFLKERLKHIDTNEVSLLYCRNCDFAYYHPRLSEHDLSFLYKGYRSDGYVAERKQFEIGYTNPVDTPKRVSDYARMFRDVLDTNKIFFMLDYGGNKGETIPPIFPNAIKCVYEPHDVEPLPGVLQIRHRQEFDFIMCCHVLEHLPYPGVAIQRILNFSHKGTVLYFEVPLDSLLGTTVFSSFARKTVAGNRLLLENYNRLTGKSPDDPRFYMHEHISHFSPKSLQYLLLVNGLISKPKVVTIAGVENVSCFCRVGDK